MMAAGAAIGTSHPGRPTYPLVSYGSAKYVKTPEPHSTHNCAHHHRDGGEPEGKRTMALLSAPIETTQALDIQNASPPLLAASESPRPTRVAPAATPAAIKHQQTGLAGWRRVIG